MSNRLFDANDILKLYNTLDKRIDKLWCFAEQCCEKVPINIGEGIGLYKRLYRNQWEFKSLIAGTNVTITENANDLTISASGGSSFIESVTDTATINLTVTGTALSADFTSLLISQFTNDSGYITSSGAALTSTYVGYGGGGNTLTGNSLFHYDIAAGLFNVEFPGSISGGSMEFYGGLSSEFYVGNATTELSIIDGNASTLKTNGIFGLKIGGGFDEAYAIGDYLTAGFGTHIYIDDGGLARSILLSATNGVTVSNLAGVGTRMVTASAIGLLSTAAITTGTVTTFTATDAQGVTWTITNPTTTPNATLALGNITPTAVSLSGTAGTGYVQLASQSLAVPTPATGVTIWADNANRFGWTTDAGFTSVFDDTANTGNRAYTLQNSSGTLAFLTDILSGTVTSFGFTNNTTFTGVVTNSTTTPNLTLTLLLVDGGTF